MSVFPLRRSSRISTVGNLEGGQKELGNKNYHRGRNKEKMRSSSNNQQDSVKIKCEMEEEVKKRKRRKEDNGNEIQNLAKILKMELEEEAGPSGMTEASTLMESAIQLFSKKHGLSQQAVRAAMTDHETLPSIHDPAAIDAFFRKNRRRSFREIVNANLHLKAASDEDLTIPPDHPMKMLVEQADKEMSVKEALAKGFRNYKVRLPKQRKSIKQYEMEYAASLDNSLLTSLLSTDESSNGKSTGGNTNSSLGTNNIRDVLAALATDGATDGSDSGDGLDVDLNSMMNQMSQDSPTTKKTIADMLIEMSSGNSMTVNDECTNLQSINEYPLPPFWQLQLEVSKGYRGGFYIKGVKYVQMTTLIHHDSIIVPVQQPIKFKCDGYLLEVSLSDLFLANGILIRDPTQCHELQKLFSACVFLIHHAISEHLLNTCGPLSTLNPLVKVNRDHNPILLSCDAPPFACHKQQYFDLALGRMYGVNEVFDNTKQPLPSRDIPSTVESTQPLNRCTLSVKDRGLVIAHFDIGTSVEDLAVKFRVLEEEIQNIVLNRSEVLREQAALYMEEVAVNKDEEQQGTIDDKDVKSKEVMAKRKNRVRRTSFVGLNILMWRFFKDCRDNGIVLNGKMLKEHAMMISRQLGLENFKGSEGWLDAFKRRHKIDLKMMSGVPVNYEENDEDMKMDEDGDDVEGLGSNVDDSSSNPHDFNISQIQSSSEGITAALLDCVEKATAPTAVASISNTKPLDLNNLFGTSESSAKEVTTSHNLSNGLLESSTSRLPPVFGFNSVIPKVHQSPPNAYSARSQGQTLDEKGFIATIIKSAAQRVPDKEISSALETIRSYILFHDPSAMHSFLDLQVKLASIMRAEAKKEKLVLNGKVGGEDEVHVGNGDL